MNLIKFILFASAISLAFSLPISFAHADSISFGFDHHPIRITESSGITYYNYDSVGNGVDPAPIEVKITAPCYRDSFIEEITEDQKDDGFYHSDVITFVSGTDSECNDGLQSPNTNGPFQIKVRDGDIIDIETLNSPVVTDYVDIVTTDGTLQWAPKLENNNYATCQNDIDGDGICDAWESHGSGGLQIGYPAGASGYKYTVPCDTSIEDDCPDKHKPDIYVELDWMAGHPPNRDALDDVKKAFANQGIRLHFELSEEISHQDELAFGGVNHPRLFGFDQVKAFYFGNQTDRDHPDWEQIGWKQKKQVFHYGIYAHSQKGNPTSSGTAELFGNDFMITFGGWLNNTSSRNYEAGTLMHELGHNLGLNHGGSTTSTVNCKPNYLSVMSYSRQLPILVPDRDLNYSNETLAWLDENDLDENEGVISQYNQKLAFGPLPPIDLPSTNEPIDWNQDGEISPSVQQLIHYLESQGCFESIYRNLPGYNDWDNINFNSRGTANWQDSTLVNPCKFGEPNPAGKCLGTMPGEDRPYGSNENSIWYDEFKERIFVDGAEELSYEDALNQHQIKVISIQDELLRLDSSQFKDKSKAKGIKNSLRGDFVNALDKIKNNDVKGSIQKLEAIKRSFEHSRHGHGPHVSEKSNSILKSIEDVLAAQKEFIELPNKGHKHHEKTSVTPHIIPIPDSPSYKIACQDKVWVKKSNDNTIACVTPSTAESLIERGWGNFLE